MSAEVSVDAKAAFAYVVQTKYARFDARAVNPRYVVEVRPYEAVGFKSAKVFLYGGESFITGCSYDETLKRLENP